MCTRMTAEDERSAWLSLAAVSLTEIPRNAVTYSGSLKSRQVIVLSRMRSSPLTILLALKGRHLHTLRFLWHADVARVPYHFLIADGEVHPVIARLLEHSESVFPHLDIEYIRYPDDVDYATYYSKLADAASRVRTPYYQYRKPTMTTFL